MGKSLFECIIESFDEIKLEGIHFWDIFLGFKKIEGEYNFS